REIGEQRNYSDDVARQIDEEVRAIIDRGYNRAMEVLVTHRDRLVALADKLVAEETVEAEEFEKLFADVPDPHRDGGDSTPRPTATEPMPPRGQPAAGPATAPAPSPSPA
ncbi:MAG: ATP-dependent zinc metalloprotease FtsH, partial [Candidatus Limnocylindrales bacterium]